MRAALGAALLLPLALSPASAQNGGGCPDGTVPVAGGGCVRDMSRGGGPFLDMRPKRRGPRCPAGTHTVESPIGFRCVMGSGDGDRDVKAARTAPAHAPPGPAPVFPAAQPQAQAQAAPPLEKVLTADPPRAAEAPAPSGPPKEFVPFRAKGLQLSLPRGWHVTDAWADEVPTVYVEQDAARRGKPVTMLVSKLAPGQEGFESLADAVEKEKADLGAREDVPRSVSGLQARQTLVAGESRSVYVAAGGGAYYLFSYSAPKDVFSVYETAFDKLLATARLR